MLETLFLTLFTLPLFIEEHDIHVSICDIEIMSRKVEITVKTFVDDLQMAVGLTPGQEIPEDYTSAEELIKTYLQESMIFSLEDNPIKLKIDDISASKDAVWITLTADIGHQATSVLSFSNTFLTEIYDDQTNIVNITAKDKKKTYSLNKKTKSIKYEFTE